MRILFMGTPDFAVPCLSRLITLQHDIIGIFTQPDKPAGRGYKLMPSAVKAKAQRHGLEIYQPESVKKGDAEAIIRGLAPELIVVVAYGKILPQSILDIPKYGCVNIHGSLLPKYRGAAPIQWSVLNGDKITGVTAMFLDAGMDTGDIITEIKTEIGENETAGELFDRLSLLGADCLEKTLSLIEKGEAVRVKQDESKATYTKMLDKSMSAIDFGVQTGLVHNKIRGLSPWPCAVTEVSGVKLKLFSSVIMHEYDGISGKSGKLLSDKRLIIGCGDGALEITSVQPEGSRKMSGEDFLRGKRLAVGTEFGIKG